MKVQHKAKNDSRLDVAVIAAHARDQSFFIKLSIQFPCFLWKGRRCESFVFQLTDQAKKVLGRKMCQNQFVVATVSD